MGLKSKSVIIGLLLIVLASYYSCKKQSKGRTVAKVEGEEITMEEVDNLVKNSLFEYLFAIYDVRRIALNELIYNKLIAKEAKAHHINVDSVTL